MLSDSQKAFEDELHLFTKSLIKIHQNWLDGSTLEYEMKEQILFALRIKVYEMEVKKS